MWLWRAAGTMLVEANVTTGLLLLLLVLLVLVLLLVTQAVVVVMVPIVGRINVAVVVLLTGSLVWVGTVAARPMAEPDVAHGEEEGAALWTVEEPVTLVGPVANSFTNR